MVNLDVSPDSYLTPFGETFKLGRHNYINCTCRLCGKEVKVDTSNLKKGHVKSCGCISSLKPRKDRTGTSTPTGIIFVGYLGNSLWRVNYSCGHQNDVPAGAVLASKTGLCNNCSNRIPTTLEHGHAPRSGESNTYSSWLSMRRRCNSPDNNRYQHYGGKGVTVCDRWDKSFPDFLKDMGECPEGYSIDRIDITKGYCKDNCQWSNDVVQANNKSNVKLISNGLESWSLRRWCIKLGLDYKNAWYKLNTKGLSVSDVLGCEYYFE
jgi:hypothetical protein